MHIRIMGALLCSVSMVVFTACSSPLAGAPAADTSTATAVVSASAAKITVTIVDRTTTSVTPNPTARVSGIGNLTGDQSMCVIIRG